MACLGVGVSVLLLGAGCSGDDDSTDDEADQEFCEDALAFMEGTAFNDPTSEDAAAALDAAEALDPPEEIADDWQMLIDGARTLADVDPAEPVDELPDEVENMGAASTNVFRYLAEDCNLDLSEEEDLSTEATTG